mmetsp:Transcript_23244/g.53962  ORF Transcript_23244/g.53962 Transcript_23244/m.53962 type:complete len:411 (+) Transcript_23244:181-1413(+)
MTIKRHQQYNRVAEHEDDEATAAIPAGNEERPAPDTAASSVDADSTDTKKTQDDEEDDEEEVGDFISIAILDAAQTRFQVSINPAWNVDRLKKEGVGIHKIPVDQQRLVYMGRMLADETILKDAGITKEDSIVHLFPKPRVVLSSSENNDAQEESVCNENTDGAHVPRIVLDPDEVEMRSSILVLGSAEVMEAQNNVKLLSFLLLIVCSMELLALFTIMLGVPQDPGNDDVRQHTDDAYDASHNFPTRSWQNSDYCDLVLNMFGFYSALLGIKATTENTRALAKRYLLCTVVCGTLWIAFYYYLNYEAEVETERHAAKASGEDADSIPVDSDLWVQAFFAVLLPMMVWCLCCYRAFRFHGLLLEAEHEAEERIQSELNLAEGNNEDTVPNNESVETPDEELALQNRTAMV